ncbi:D-3-phosphoglycerate dehydrogenase [Methanobrevibacter cuticularis]|uniref:D-3-phosphoglycerate dehydrogenase n=1 Tax=Methanobrevibacter cuticularis TaxID=47311 RepID=A0A166FLV5_9EURY|nr:phosphoglycerate dehydrogenase [Methanobrevibacter cuticularis]KZX17812.1 D-3-phosphoglycerate dehydrogenase [Methanobrevibacter cuticularis]
MKVIVADAINQQGIDNLEKVAEVVVDTNITPEELLNTISEYDAIIVRSRTKVTREVIENAEKLKIIARAGVGVDNVDVEAATEKGIMVVNAPESTSITVAEHTMGLMLSIARKITIADKSVKESKWEKSRFMGVELRNKTLGVVGMGRIGSQVVSRCKAFEMNAIVYDPYLPEKVAKQMGVQLADLNTVLKEADFITIHVPLTDETKHLISTKEIKMMKNDSYIINCARGGIIDEEALYEGLVNEEIGGAALDVYEIEPPVDNKLLTLDNIVVTPHIAASTREAQRDAAIIVANEVIEVLESRVPKNVLNMPVVDPKTYEEIKPYLNLCKKLGSFITQSINGQIRELEILYSGKLAKIPNQDILTRTILQGILNPILNDPVNTINAATIARARGIKVTEGKTSDANGYDSLVKVKGISDNDVFSVEGTDMHEPTIIKINDYWVDVKPEGHMFISKYQDVPGAIGTIGTKLGERNINIGIMQVGRDIAGGKAIMILTVDQKIPEDVMEEVRKLENVFDAVGLEL